MPTKETTARKKSATAVVSSIETHAEAAGKALAPLFKGVLKKGEVAPDMAFVLTVFGRVLARDNDAAVAADDAHESEKADDDLPRTTRDAAAIKVRDACTHARDGVDTVYGASALKLLGMATPPPSATDGAGLARWAEGAVGKLTDAKVVLPAPQKRGVSVDRKALAEDITDQLSVLSGALKDVERERRELEGTQVAKNRAIEQNDATFSIVANLATAVLRAAGMPEQADKVRPSARRPGRTESNEEDPDGEK